MSKHTPGYEVTSDGKVFSISHNWRGYGRRELSQSLNSYGYPSVRLSIGGSRKRVTVHVLVAEKFLGEKPSQKHQVRHLNGDKTDNRACNLAWGTAKENADDRERHGRTSSGASHSASIRSSCQAERTREYHANRSAKAKGEQQ